MRRMKTITPALLVALMGMGGIILSGCSSSAGVQGTSALMEEGYGDIGHSEYVIVNNPKVARGLQIVDMATKYVGNLLMANVTLVSKYSDTERYKYKFSWYDEDGLELDPEAYPWIPLTMYGNETKTIKGIAPNPAARQFKVNLIFAD